MPERAQSPAPERALITGLGIAAPAGVGVSEFWPRLLEGAIEPVRPKGREGARLPERAHVFEPELEAERWVDRRKVRKISDLSRIAVVAAKTCLDDAGLGAEAGEAGADAASAAREPFGCFLGTAFGSSGDHLEYHEELLRSGLNAASALLFSQSVFNAASGHISQVFGLRGPNLTVVGGDQIGLSAHQLASDRIRLGSLSGALAGGVEQYCDLVVACLSKDGLIDDATPFAEGSSVSLVESVASARARGARAYATVLGQGETSRGETPSSAAACMALADAGAAPSDVDLVVADPTSLGELDAFLPAGVRATSPIGWTGQGFGYSSAMLVLAATLALHHGVAPPSREPSPAGGTLRFTREAFEQDFSRVLVVSHSRPGAASAMLLGPAPADLAR